jgi:hypothetical protein
VAATENEAVWPAVTVWLVGCVVIAGATGAGPFELETIPAQPEFHSPTSITNKTRAQRFIVCLSFA